MARVPARKPKKKLNPLKAAKIEAVDYKDTAMLRKFISDRGKIHARRVTGVSLQEQRQIAQAIQRAREAALLPSYSAIGVLSGGKSALADVVGGAVEGAVRGGLATERIKWSVSAVGLPGESTESKVGTATAEKRPDQAESKLQEFLLDSMDVKDEEAQETLLAVEKRMEARLEELRRSRPPEGVRIRL